MCVSLLPSLLKNSSSESFNLKRPTKALAALCEIIVPICMLILGSLGIHGILPLSSATSYALFGAGLALTGAMVLFAVTVVTLLHKNRARVEYQFQNNRGHQRDIPEEEFVG